jgi:hypothetical protein
MNGNAHGRLKTIEPPTSIPSNPNVRLSNGQFIGQPENREQEKCVTSQQRVES